MKNENQSSKPVRLAFENLVNEHGITDEEISTFKKVGELMSKAENDPETKCSGWADKCISGDCGYKEGGCGNDEQCSKCDSCMLAWDTCSSSMCGTTNF